MDSTSRLFSFVFLCFWLNLATYGGDIFPVLENSCLQLSPYLTDVELTAYFAGNLIDYLSILKGLQFVFWVNKEVMQR